MRNLTIKREKSFVACLAKARVYIEDAVYGEIKINGVPCRKLGDLKNGEEKTFQIDEGAAKVFVIADKLSKNYCNEYYEIPGGQENIFLWGQNKFNPASGNAFRFANNNSQEVVASRKRNTRKGWIILIVAMIVGVTCGLFASGVLFGKDGDAKTFSSDGMTITLTDEFRKGNVAQYTAVYDSENIAVFALKEEFTLMDGLEDYTLDQYLNLMLQANNLSKDNIKKNQGLTGFVYDATNPDTKEVYRYFSYVYKADDAFWAIQFAVLAENAGEYEQQIIEWAKSVEFSKGK